MESEDRPVFTNSEIKKINDFEELEIISDKNKIIIRKPGHPDIFGNEYDEECCFEYQGNKISKKSILDLSRMAGIIE